MNLNFNFTGKTTLSAWWKIVRDNLTAIKNTFETHQTASELDHPDDSVKQRHIADKAVGTDQLADNAVTAEKIENKTVTAAQIADKTVTAEKMADKTIGAAQIEDYAISNMQLAQYAITTSKIYPQAVQGAHIKDQAVTKTKLDTALQEQLDAFQEHLDEPAGELGDGQVTTSKLADAAVTAEKIHTNSINTFKIIDGAVTKEKIAENAINNEKIIDQSITEDKLDKTTRSYLLNYFMDTRTGTDCLNNFNRASWQSNWYSFNSRYGELTNAPSDTTTYKDGYIRYTVLVVPIDVDNRIQVAFNLGSHRRFWRIIGAVGTEWTEIK